MKIISKTVLDCMDKILELQNMVKTFSDSEKKSISLVTGDKLSIKKHGDSFQITLDKKDIDKMSLDALRWGLQSHLSLIKNGRFPSVSKQFLFLVFPLIIYALSYFTLMVFKLSAEDSLNNIAIGLTFFISYIGMSAWSRKKILQSDSEANTLIGKEFGVEYLSFYMDKEKEADFFIRDNSVFYVFYLFSSYPSFFQRIKRLS